MIGSELPKLKTAFYESHFCHCVPQSTQINVQSPQSESTPMRLTLIVRPLNEEYLTTTWPVCIHSSSLYLRNFCTIGTKPLWIPIKIFMSVQVVLFQKHSFTSHDNDNCNYCFVIVFALRMLHAKQKCRLSIKFWSSFLGFIDDVLLTFFSCMISQSFLLLRNLFCLLF